jgi:primosomal protein N' (replication factor Y)
MQVGGRSGRAELPGEVLIQTEYPDHALYLALVEHDYARFAASQLDERRMAGFPPFSSQAMLRAEAREMAQALDFLAAARAAAEPLAAGVTLYDPVPMRLQRLMTLERGQLLVESLKRPSATGLPCPVDGAAVCAEDACRPALASGCRSARVLETRL